MRGLLYLLSIVGVVALAYWAYHQGYETRAMAREVTDLQRELRVMHEELSVLRAEWAYLNRPDRLRVLAEMNFETLGLMPLAPEQFGTVTQVAFPPPPAPEVAAPTGEALREALDGGAISEVETLQGQLPQPEPQIIQATPHAPEPEPVVKMTLQHA